MALSGVDIRVLTYEIRTEVEKSWISNIYQLPNNIFIFKIRLPQEGTRFLLIEPGKRIHLTNFNRTMPKEPSNLVKTLRSHLRNTMINSITQNNIDRIITINVGPNDGYNLVIELFGEGNLILVNPQNKIISAIRYRKMRDRDIHPGKIFIEMPSLGDDIFTNSTETFSSMLKTEGKIVPVLNRLMGLGPHYSKYIINKSEINKKNLVELDDDDINNIITNIMDLKKILTDNQYKPTVYLDQVTIKENSNTKDDSLIQYDEQWGDEELPFKPDEVVKIYPWPQPMVDQDELTIFHPESLNAAYDVYFSSQETNEDLEEETEEINIAMQKLETQLIEQKKHMENMKVKSKELQSYGDAIYSNFKDVNELLTTIYTAKKNNVDWDTIVSNIQLGKSKNIPAALIFEDVIPSTAELVILLPHNNENLNIKLDFRKSITDNANIFYTEAKKSIKKSKGAQIAIEKTINKIETATKDKDQNLSKKQEKVVILKRRKSWFEKFHWLELPNGVLIVSGSDASTNEKLVKRYLDEEDYFAHADLHGAASVIIKTNGNGLSNEVKSVACQMAVCYSSGWKGKLSTANAFIVNKDQVSLTPPSGQFLPKGSFMIYGEKSQMKNLPLELSIGVVIEKHWARIIVGPKQYLAHADMTATIIPGDDPKSSIAKNIQSKFRKMADPIAAEKIKAIDISEFIFHIPDNSKIIDFELKN